MKTNIIYNRDCLEGMKELPDNSIDLIATAPPYGISFMGKQWDRAIPSLAIWKESLRVLKPGAVAFVMCIPRQDCLARMIISLEDVGFNISFSSIFHTFAQGFPKAQNVSLTIDKKECRKQLEKKLGRKPTMEEFKEVWEGFRKTVGKYIPPQDNPKNRWTPKNAMYNREIQAGLFFGNKHKKDAWDITAPATPAAKALDGSYGGFQPKPAVEVILVAMKPLQKTDKNKVNLDFEQLRKMKRILLDKQK